MKLTRVPVERLCSPEEASSVVGDMVSDRVPSEFLKPGTVLHDAHTHEPVLAYVKLPGSAAELRRALLRLYVSGAATKAKPASSRTFGYATKRVVLGREGCALTAIARDQPDVERVLEQYADVLSEILTAVDPTIVTRAVDITAAVLPDWKLGKTKVWTSGVVNHTAQLPYHRDGLNFPVWSGMPVVRRGTRGGHLHLPEYDVVVPCADSTVTLFEGFRYVHGVTPIRMVQANGYRISAVYYALRGMGDCFTHAAETARSQKRRTDRELEMARRIAAGDMSIPGGNSVVDRGPMADWRGMTDSEKLKNASRPRQ